MVTDEQYKALQRRVDDMEKKLNLLSRQYSALYMKRDMTPSFSKTRESEKRKDTTRYFFDGMLCCKRKLVLNCIKKYVADHPGTRGPELEDVFPDYIQGSLGVIRKAQQAEKYSNASSRFFFADEDILSLIDDQYVVCAQWDKKNIERFISLVNDLGYKVEIKHRSY